MSLVQHELVWLPKLTFGCYQMLADLMLVFGAGPGIKATSPSGHAEGDGKTIDGCVDGNPETKWCVRDAGKTVSWEKELRVAKSVWVWVLEGSADGPVTGLRARAVRSLWISNGRPARSSPIASRPKSRVKRECGSGAR